MQTLRSLAVETEKLFSEIDQAVEGYAAATGLACLPQCGACCLSPTVEISLLDALPVALELAAEGRGEAIAETLRQQSTPGCPLFMPLGGHHGRCSRYQRRPSLCRLFGFAAVRDKKGTPVLALCRVHKEHGTTVDPAVTPPLYEEFSRRLQLIHPGYGTELRPIHRAIAAALEKILLAQRLEEQLDSEVR